ncbi:hypothetical protein ES703_77395 [subsurface metagenome]
MVIEPNLAVFLKNSKKIKIFTTKSLILGKKSVVFLEDGIRPVSFRVDEQEQVAIKFSRSEVQAILNAGEVELTITGQLTDGTAFEGTDVIRVIDEGRKK